MRDSVDQGSRNDVALSFLHHRLNQAGELSSSGKMAMRDRAQRAARFMAELSNQTQQF
jgi:hypothetical protein